MIHTALSAFETAHWERVNRRHDIRELTLYEDDDGSFVVHGRLTPEQGALVKKALEAGMDEDFQEQKTT